MEKSSLDILLCSKIIQYLNNMRIFTQDFTQSIANNPDYYFADHSVSQLIWHISKVNVSKQLDLFN